LHLPLPVASSFRPAFLPCSTKSTRLPHLAAVIAAIIPEAPAPMTAQSNRSIPFAIRSSSKIQHF
jgi:hypothetical protein